jgi:hypothetical protein
MWRDWVAPGSIATDMTTVACACDQSFSPGLDEEEQDGMFSWPTKLQKASSEGPSFQVADCRGASPNGYFATVPRSRPAHSHPERDARSPGPPEEAAFTSSVRGHSEGFGWRRSQPGV